MDTTCAPYGPYTPYSTKSRALAHSSSFDASRWCSSSLHASSLSGVVRLVRESRPQSIPMIREEDAWQTHARPSTRRLTLSAILSRESSSFASLLPKRMYAATGPRGRSRHRHTGALRETRRRDESPADRDGTHSPSASSPTSMDARHTRQRKTCFVAILASFEGRMALDRLETARTSESCQTGSGARRRLGGRGVSSDVGPAWRELPRAARYCRPTDNLGFRHSTTRQRHGRARPPQLRAAGERVWLSSIVRVPSSRPLRPRVAGEQVWIIDHTSNSSTGDTRSPGSVMGVGLGDWLPGPVHWRHEVARLITWRVEMRGVDRQYDERTVTSPRLSSCLAP